MMRRQSATSSKTQDVESVVQQVVRGNLKDSIPNLRQIFQTNHLYLQQWQSIEWTLPSIKGAVEIIRRYEGEELKYQGITVDMLHYMLALGVQQKNASFFSEDKDCLTVMVATLLQMMIEQVNYNQCHLTLRFLLDANALGAERMFSIGSTLIDQITAGVQFRNFTSLLCLASYATARQPSAISPAIKVLSHCSNFIISDWTANYFLPKQIPFILSGLTIRESGKHNAQETVIGAVQLLRRLVTVHEQNAVDVVNNPEIVLELHSLVLEKVSSSLVQCEVIDTFTVLTRVQSFIPHMKSMFTVSFMTELAQSCRVETMESLLNLYIRVYEADLVYHDDSFQYHIEPASEHERFVSLIVQHCASQLQGLSSAPAASQSRATCTLECIARIFSRLERHFSLLSNPMMCTAEKIMIVQACQRLLGEDPAQFALHLLPVTDIVCFLLRGAQRCWLPPAFDPLDEDFIVVSSALVEQFLSVTQKKLFDVRDEHSLHYLAGDDQKSPIQTMIAKSQEDGAIHESLAGKLRAQSPQQQQPSSSSSPSSSAKSSSSPHSPLQSSIPPSSSSSSSVNSPLRSQYLVCVEQLLQGILLRISWLQTPVSKWELESSTLLARRVTYLALVVRLLGVEEVQRILPDFANVCEFLFQALTDSSLGFSNFAGMEMKCLELMSFLLIHRESGFEHSLALYEFLLQLLRSNPETFSERSRSEYNRGQVSVAAPGGIRPSTIDMLLSSSPLHPDGMNNSENGFNPVKGDGETSSATPALWLPPESTFTVYRRQVETQTQALDTLLVLAENDKSIRRKLVSTSTSLLDALLYYHPASAIIGRPVLHLVTALAEFASKLEVDAEETIVTLILRSLSSPLQHIRFQTCNLIYAFGLESPGFVFRGLSRREVENHLLVILHQVPFHFPRVIIAAIKATATLVHNFNIKPVWLPSPVVYHWSVYQATLQRRPLLGVQGLALVIHLLRHAQVPYRLLYFTYTLSLSASLMYACSEHAGNPLSAADLEQLQQLKDFLIANILPWLPLAIDFISLGKRKRRFEKVGQQEAAAFPSSEDATNGSGKRLNTPTSNANSGSSSPNHAVLSSNTASLSAAGALSQQGLQRRQLYDDQRTLWHCIDVKFGSPSAVSSAAKAAASSDPQSVTVTVGITDTARFLYALPKDTLPSLATSPPVTSESGPRNSRLDRDSAAESTADSEEGPSSTRYAFTASDLSHSRETLLNNNRDSAKPPSPVAQQQLMRDIFRSKCMEFLTLKTIDALYAFLCMDDMYPLSTYLRHTHLFEQCQVIASVSYFMSENVENALLLKRGMDLLRYFADHQMQLSGIAMHSPPALVAALRTMQDTLEVQLSFAKIILAVAWTDDDFAKENLLRFRVHVALLEMLEVESPHIELVRTVLQALHALAAVEGHAKEMCKAPDTVFVGRKALSAEDHNIVDAILRLLELPQTAKDAKLQFYALRLLTQLEGVQPQYIQPLLRRRKATLGATLRKSQKLLRKVFLDDDSSGGTGGGSGAVAGASAVSAAATRPSAAAGRTLSSAAAGEEITRGEVEAVLSTPLMRQERCVIS